MSKEGTQYNYSQLTSLVSMYYRNKFYEEVSTNTYVNNKKI